MKYRLIEYKTNEIRKLRISLIYLSESIVNFDNIPRLIDQLIDIHRFTNAKLNVRVIFTYESIKDLTYYLSYDIKDDLFWKYGDNVFFLQDLIDKYKLNTEINKIESKLNKINKDDLIDFILNYNKE